LLCSKGVQRHPASLWGDVLPRGARHPCIGYLEHPLKKVTPWTFIATSFSLSGGTQPSKEQGNGSLVPEKTGGYGQQILREGRHTKALGEVS